MCLAICALSFSPAFFIYKQLSPFPQILSVHPKNLCLFILVQENFILKEKWIMENAVSYLLYIHYIYANCLLTHTLICTRLYIQNMFNIFGKSIRLCIIKLNYELM